MRISIEKDDPGYRLFCMRRGDNLRPIVFLDGVQQNWVITADTIEGLVKRTVITAAGNIAHDGIDFLTESVFGKVSIDFEK
jgi:hypothetical protein